MSDSATTTDEITRLLRAAALCAGLEPQAIAMLASGTSRVRLREGEILYHYGDVADATYVLLSGRLRAVATARSGGEVSLGYLDPGEEFGVFSAIESGRRSATVLATTDSELLVIRSAVIHTAIAESKQLAFNLLAGFGRQMKRVINLHRGERPASKVVIITDVHGQAFVNELIEGIAAYGRTVLFHSARGNVPHVVAKPPLTSEQNAESLEVPKSHIVIAEWINEQLRTPDASQLAGFDHVVWVVPFEARSAIRSAIQELTREHAGWLERIRIVWLLRSGEQVGPARLDDLGVRDFKVGADPSATLANDHRRGVQRVVRDLLGLRRGLALSGGGAKGMAHLGVLHSLDRAGIDFDALVGTSGGALAGTLYAAGYTPDFCVKSFTRDLARPWVFRRMPHGKNLHLLWCFRTGRFDGMLRPYLFDWKLSQLPLPFSTVTVDLVTGREVVRDSTDAVHSILESINVPGVARPIVRGDQSLVDGGVLNNLASDVLVAKGVGFVVGVDVTRKLRSEFAGISPGRTVAHRPGTTESLFRLLEVLSYSTNIPHARAADYMIEPDLSLYGFADFDKTPQMAEVGEQATESCIPELRAAITRDENRVLNE